MEEDTTISIIAETQPYEEKLDSEITSIKEQSEQTNETCMNLAVTNIPTVAALSHRSSILSTHLLTSKASQSLLHQSQPSSNGVRPTQHETSPLLSALATRSRAQTLHNQQNLHRLCAGVTTFSVRDPDPRALDSGRILGVRIEALSKGPFSIKRLKLQIFNETFQAVSSPRTICSFYALNLSPPMSSYTAIQFLLASRFPL